MADLLEQKGVKFKPVAYRRAAHGIENLPEELGGVDEEGKLEEIPGVGTHLSAKIHEILSTGRLAYLDRLEAEIPEGVRKLADLEGIGPKKALLLSRLLGITSLDQLEEAARAGKIRNLPGFGEKSERNILLSLRQKTRGLRRHLLGEILPEAESILDQLAGLTVTRKISLAGSIRRRKETIRDVDILATSPEPEKIISVFVSLHEVDRIIGRGPTKSTVLLKSGIQVDLRVVKEDEYWTALIYFTGSKDHNIALRRRALERNWRLNEYGLVDLATAKKFPVGSERDLYARLGLPYIEPELRECTGGEIEAGTLPALVPYDAIKGDLHLHTRWSDGLDTIGEMAAAARSLGYEYIAICDHSRSREIPRGMTEESLRDQWREIEQVNRDGLGVAVLRGIECGIDAEGMLDLPDAVLKDLDLVMARVHSGLEMTKGQMTKRIIAAMHNEHLDLIGHPTGRILQQRDPARIDLTAVFREAAALGVCMEINALPSRLDLSDTNCRMAKEHGVRCAIGSDARSRENLRNMAFGLATARRGWLEAKDLINTLPLTELRRILEP